MSLRDRRKEYDKFYLDKDLDATRIINEDYLCVCCFCNNAGSRGLYDDEGKEIKPICERSCCSSGKPCSDYENNSRMIDEYKK